MQSDIGLTELNWTDNNLVFDKLTNGQAVMLHSRHRVTASVTTWLRARTRQPMGSVWSPISQFVKKLNRRPLYQLSQVQLLRSVSAFRRSCNLQGVKS